NKKFVGHLNVHVISARNLVPIEPMVKVDIFGAERPSTYVILKYAGSFKTEEGNSSHHKHFSNVVKKDFNPQYNEMFQFELSEEKFDLHIEIFQQNNFSDDELVGKATIDLSQLLHGQSMELDVYLDREGSVVGTVRMLVSFNFLPLLAAAAANTRSLPPIDTSPPFSQFHRQVEDLFGIPRNER
ncbi:hypothetical protein GUITHDRAFT_151212, partial [Guillardia theta CCMP2712]